MGNNKNQVKIGVFLSQSEFSEMKTLQLCLRKNRTDLIRYLISSEIRRLNLRAIDDSFIANLARKEPEPEQQKFEL
jgi:hypothetical protein